MGLLNIFKKNKDNEKKILTINAANRSVFNVIEGATPGFYQFGLNKEGIEIIKPMKFKPLIVLNYNDIIDIEVNLINKDNLKNKSVVGRAIVGSLVAGSLGAIVGGMSGTGSKVIKELDLELVIKLKDKNDIKIEGRSIKGDYINKAKTFIKFLQYNLTDNNLLDVSGNAF